MKSPTSRRVRALGAALVVGAALAAPAGALAKPAPATPKAIESAAKRSHAALVLSAKLAAGTNDGKALKVFLKSRAELGKARAGVKIVVKRATTPKARVRAARALAIVAEIESKNLPKLIGMVDDVKGSFQKAVAKATLVDTMARDRAVDVLQVLLAGVPASALEDLSNTVSSLMTGHIDEVLAGVGVLKKVGVPGTVKSILSTTLGATLQGQAGAAGALKDLIVALPDDVAGTLEKTFDVVRKEQERAFTLLNGVLDKAPLPPAVRNIVDNVIDTTRNLIDGLLSTIAPTPPVATTPTSPSTDGGSTPVVDTPVTPVVPNPADLLSGILGSNAIPVNLINDILRSIPNPLQIVNGILGSVPSPTQIVNDVMKAVPDPTTLVNSILGGLTGGLTGGATTTPAPTTPAAGVFPDPSQLLNALLPGGLNPFQLLNGILGGAPAQS